MKELFIFSLLVIMFSITSCSRYGSSQRTGQIVKIASEGYLIKTTEVEIIKGFLNGGSGSFGSKFDFTISNQDLIAIAKKAFDEGKEITVNYHSNAFCPLSSETNDCIFADGIIIK